MAPYRRENREPLPIALMTSGKEGAMEQGSGIETVVDGYQVGEVYTGHRIMDDSFEEKGEPWATRYWRRMSVCILLLVIYERWKLTVECNTIDI